MSLRRGTDVFLDRDGVIIRNRPAYVRSWADVEVLPGALEAIARLSRRGRVVVITNQSAVGRGIVTAADVDDIHHRLDELVRGAGGLVSAYHVCPHRPDEGCACRKPKPGLLLQAAAELNIDLAAAMLVGDQVADLLAAAAVGTAAILVESGVDTGGVDGSAPPHRRAPDLAAAVRLIEAGESR